MFSLKKFLICRGYVGAFIDHKKPLIALVNGPAIGISVTVMGMFDLVYASDKVRLFAKSLISTYYPPILSL